MHAAQTIAPCVQLRLQLVQLTSGYTDCTLSRVRKRQREREKER